MGCLNVKEICAYGGKKILDRVSYVAAFAFGKGGYFYF
jgi:hypothetical protein